MGLEPTQDAVCELGWFDRGGSAVVCAGDNPESAVVGADCFQLLRVVHADVFIDGASDE